MTARWQRQATQQRRTRRRRADTSTTTTATSDGDERQARRSRRRSGRGQGGHDDNKATGNTPTTMNMMLATDGITVADTMTTGTTGTTTSGSSDINVAPPDFYSCATTRRPYSISRRACSPSQSTRKRGSSGC